MKLAFKFTLAFLIVLCTVLLLYGYSVSRREISMFENDLKRDQSILGHALALAVRQEWEHRGEAGIVGFVAVADQTEAAPGETVQWIWLDRAADLPVASAGSESHVQEAEQRGLGVELPGHVIEALRQGRQATWVDPSSGSFGRRFTDTPVRVGAGGLGVVQVGESLEDEHLYTRRTIANIAIATAVVAAVAALMAMLLGVRLVGRPVSVLIRRAREVAAGDLERHLDFRQRDELRELADELNAMCDQLAAARRRVAEETSARIATVEQLRHADRLKTVGQLASGLAHELGTPLNVVRARAKMVASQTASSDAGAAANAQIIVEQSDRITRIIRQLLDFARPRSPRRARTDLSQVAEKTLSLLTSIADKRGVRLELTPPKPPLAKGGKALTPPQPPVGKGGQTEAAVMAEVDPDQLQQVLSNLVLNAIQAVPSGGAVTVTVGMQRVRPPVDHGGPEGEFVRIDVRDEGEGIPEENLPRVFEPFFTTKQVGEGTGLGLSVSQGIVREHCGWMMVESKVGQGSCFSVFLPEGVDHAETSAHR